MRGRAADRYGFTAATGGCMVEVQDPRTVSRERLVQIAGASHLSFVDIPFLPLTAGSSVRATLAQTTIEPARMLAVTGTLLVAFLTGQGMAGVLRSDAIRPATAALPWAPPPG